jgi:hypothetical protein
MQTWIMSIFTEGIQHLLLLTRILLLRFFLLMLAHIAAFTILTVLFVAGDVTSGFVMERQGALALQVLTLCSTSFALATSRARFILKVLLETRF